MSDAGLSREEFEKEYPPPSWAINANGLEVAKAIHYGQREMKDKWAGFQKGWQAASSQLQADPEASTQPKCNCGAGDDAYLACHADVCALKKWAAPRYEISQETKEEWARRIADEYASYETSCEPGDDKAIYDNMVKGVLALMTNEGEKI